MAQKTNRSYFENMSAGAVSDLIEATQNREPVSGLTHKFYRYPARFSPQFVRAAIKSFSSPGDLVLDPFMGGGTTLVEALALGRCAIGVDISSLAAFVSNVKTTTYSEKELAKLDTWSSRTASSISMSKRVARDNDYIEAGYQRNLSGKPYWRLRKAIEQSVHQAKKLDNAKLEKFARCVVLRTAQWALDGRKCIPSLHEFREALLKHSSEMIEGSRELRKQSAAKRNGNKIAIHCLHRSSIGLENSVQVTKIGRPQLVLTSPPYPGIHVLYHRWQVDGRKETPAPFWIANKLDGSGGTYYTMGDRKSYELQSYFEQLRENLGSVVKLCDKKTIVVQVVAFSEPVVQLSRYLAVADDVGMEEVFLPTLKTSGDGRLWRNVPNRKWHAHQKGKTGGSFEVVLFHRLVK